MTFRVDHNFINQQQLSLYYYFENVYDDEPFSRLGGSGTNLPGFGNETESPFSN